jgi:GntR family transcriptional repressor for pyruvate dehydrogenase complex
MQIEAIEREPLYARVVEQVRYAIEDGSLKPGDRLPTEQELAGRFGVSRTVIREALGALKVLGLIESKQGAGNYVMQAPSSGQLLVERLWRMIERGNPIQILEARAILEVNIAPLAACRRTELHLNEMLTALDLLEQAIKKGDLAVAQLDVDFHLAVAKATQNPLLIAMTEVGLERIHTELWEAIRELGRPIPRQEYLRQHQALYHAIEKGDPDEARCVAAAHFASMEAYFVGDEETAGQ